MEAGWMPPGRSPRLATYASNLWRSLDQASERCAGAEGEHRPLVRPSRKKRKVRARRSLPDTHSRARAQGR